MTRMRLVNFRVLETEYLRLVAAAGAARTSLSELLRDRACASPDSPPPVPVALVASVPDGPLIFRIASRLTASEGVSLIERAKECELPIAAYVRQVLRGDTPTARRPQVHAALVALSRVGNNLNQLTRLAHGGTLISRDLYRAIEALRVEVYQVRAEILSALEGSP